MTFIQQKVVENRRLWAELGDLNESDADYESKRKVIADKIRLNNRDIRAFAVGEKYQLQLSKK